MRVLFLQALTYPFIGIMSMSAQLKQNGHETGLHLMSFKHPREKDYSEIRNFSPDIVAVPIYTGWHIGILKFCRILKEKIDARIIVGGPHPSYFSDIVQDDAIDYSCVGEGENSFTDLANRLEKGERSSDIAGIWVKKDGKIVDNGPSPLADMTLLPHMDIGLYLDASEQISNETYREFSMNRGCPFSCTYCNSPTLKRLYGKDKILRSKTAEQAIEEIKYVYDQKPFKSVGFVSDNFVLSKGFAQDFLDKYRKEINLPFFCQIRLEMIDDNLVELLHSAGCYLVTTGIESGSERVRKDILGRSMSNEKIITACRSLQEKGIQINANNMVGIPGETYEEAWDTVRLNAEICPTSSWCSIFQPFPGSALTDQLLENGTISLDVFDKIPASYFEKSVLPLEKLQRWVNLQRWFQIAVWHPKWQKLIRLLCEIRIPRIFDICFLWAYMRYVKNAYQLSWPKSFMKLIRNAYEAIKA